MALMSMQELFYGASEPAYFVHYGRQSSLPEPRMSRPMEFTTFDLMVPMCCKKCEDKVRDALLDLSSVKDVVCDPYNQRVTVTGYLDPSQALQQVKRVKSGATYWSESSHSKQYRYEVSSYQKPQYLPQHDNRSYAPSDTSLEKPRTSYPDHYNRSRTGNYFWTSCPGGYRESAVTHVVSVNPTIAIRVEMAR